MGNYINFEIIAAYLAGECNEAEKQEIDSWRQANLRNEQDFQRWKQLWETSQVNMQAFTPDVSKAWQKVKPAEVPAREFTIASPSIKVKQRHLGIWIRNIAALLLLAAGTGWGVWKMSMPDLKWIEKTSVKAAKQEILLADGTHIWLNALSKIHYPERFNSDTREVFLEGEAYFEVAENPEKPFLVHSQGSLIQVLGTTFTVRSYAAEPTVEVNLLSGKVSFSLEKTQPGQKVKLLPGQKAILDKASELISVSENDNQNFLAWKTGKLAFQDVALREALQTLEVYYQIDFTVSDSLLLNCRFTGSFTEARLEDVLQVFAFGSDISYRKQGNQYVLSGKGCQ